MNILKRSGRAPETGGMSTGMPKGILKLIPDSRLSCLCKCLGDSDNGFK